ncbi:tRNA dihydrouridine synthase DusB [Candidatus Gracilibacteria bacterium]|nr:tRNA dihydrouridine synthase DusB [Candidatus Gracilibacteria bacterium]
MNFWKKLKHPILVLAPMAGYTESPFRRLIKELEPSVILVSELISAEALRRKNEKTLRMIEFTPQEKHYYGIQLFGNEESCFLDAAKEVEKIGADFIDLNLGCPSPKIINSGHGSALLKNPLSTVKMIEALVKNTSLPVSVKMRLGFYDDNDLLETTKNLENAGISAIAIHGRTTKQRFSGTADWEKIYAVKNILNIPVIGNGDITSAQIAKERLQNLDGIMIGRASIRNPWIFKQCREIFEGKPLTPKPNLEQQLAFFKRHATFASEFKNEKWAMLELRKHFAHFLRGFPNAAQFRDRLMRVETQSEMNKIFEEISTHSNS